MKTFTLTRKEIINKYSKEAYQVFRGACGNDRTRFDLGNWLENEADEQDIQDILDLAAKKHNKSETYNVKRVN